MPGVEARATDQLGHEGVAGHELAVRQGARQGHEVEVVARERRPVGVVAFEQGSEGACAAAFGRAVPVGQAQTARELPQELEQAQIGPGAGLDPVDRGLGHPHEARAHGLAEHGLEW